MSAVFITVNNKLPFVPQSLEVNELVWGSFTKDGRAVDDFILDQNTTLIVDELYIACKKLIIKSKINIVEKTKIFAAFEEIICQNGGGFYLDGKPYNISRIERDPTVVNTVRFKAALRSNRQSINADANANPALKKILALHQSRKPITVKYKDEETGEARTVRILNGYLLDYIVAPAETTNDDILVINCPFTPTLNINQIKPLSIDGTIKSKGKLFICAYNFRSSLNTDVGYILFGIEDNLLFAQKIFAQLFKEMEEQDNKLDSQDLKRKVDTSNNKGEKEIQEKNYIQSSSASAAASIVPAFKTSTPESISVSAGASAISTSEATTAITITPIIATEPKLVEVTPAANNVPNIIPNKEPIKPIENEPKAIPTTVESTTATKPETVAKNTAAITTFKPVDKTAKNKIQVSKPINTKEKKLHESLSSRLSKLPKSRPSSASIAPRITTSSTTISTTTASTVKSAARVQRPSSASQRPSVNAGARNQSSTISQRLLLLSKPRPKTAFQSTKAPVSTNTSTAAAFTTHAVRKHKTTVTGKTTTTDTKAQDARAKKK